MIAKIKQKPVNSKNTKEYIFYKVRRSRESSVEVMQFVGQRVRVLSDGFDKDGFIWCRTYGTIKSDVLFHKHDLVKIKKRKYRSAQLRLKFLL